MDKQELTRVLGKAKVRTSSRYIMLDIKGRTYYFLPADEGGKYDGWSQDIDEWE